MVNAVRVWSRWMTRSFYSSGSDRAVRVGDLFGAVARRYDLLNDLQSFGWHRRWKRRVVALSGVRAGDRALDVCCGTGDIAFGLARTGAVVVGLDFSGPMLEVAESRRDRREPSATASQQPQAPNPQFLRGDALKLPFPDDAFEVVTVGYGLRNLSSWQAGVREMMRVARPGGRILVLEFGKPENRAWRSVYFAYLRFFVPILGLVFCRNAAAYAYILESLSHYPSQVEVAAGMRAIGLTAVRVENLFGGVMSIHVGQKPAPESRCQPGRGTDTIAS